MSVKAHKRDISVNTEVLERRDTHDDYLIKYFIKHYLVNRFWKFASNFTMSLLVYLLFSVRQFSTKNIESEYC